MTCKLLAWIVIRTILLNARIWDTAKEKVSARQKKQTIEWNKKDKGKKKSKVLVWWQEKKIPEASLEKISVDRKWKCPLLFQPFVLFSIAWFVGAWTEKQKAKKTEEKEKNVEGECKRNKL